MYKNALKEDLIRVVEDLDGTVESTDTIAKLKTKIEKSSAFESDADFVKTLIKNCIDEKVSRNERQATLEKQKIELAKLQYTKVEEKQFETDIENMIKSIKTLSLPIPTRSENFYLFFRSLERAFLIKKINEEYKSEILINLQVSPRECLNSFKNAVKSSGETYIQFAARLTANFQYYYSLRKVNSFESLCDLLISDKLFETLNKETATHIGIREAEDWFMPIDLAKECDIYISSRSGSHDIPLCVREPDVYLVLRNYRVLKTASEYGLELNFKKYHFIKSKIEFLGHIIEKGTIKPSLDKTKAVQNFPEPKNVKQVQSFLGLSGYFRKFIQNYPIIAKPLSDLLRDNVVFHFGPEQQLAFQILRQKLSENPVLHIFKQGAKLELHTDGSKFGYGVILLQQSDENKLHPIHYFSKKTTPQEEKYSSYELEVLAVIESLKKFRNYLVGNKFKIVTDCSAFQKTISKKQLTPKIASRYPVMTRTYDEITTKLANYPRNDEYINSLKTPLENKPINDFVVKNHVLYKIENDNDVLVLPQQMQTEIVKNIHSKGHLGINKTESMSTSSRDALEKLKQQEITFGNPHRIITDKGTAFTSKEFREYCENENIQLSITTGITRGNEQIERIHSSLITILSKLSIDDASKWYKFVLAVQREHSIQQFYEAFR
ncbi:retrovirus-related Pol polyprotein from transposon 17.6 [Trichonephila clavipes]|uniref:Retrovirus-related Pol polyprotein from transposon 17.6 n=1 Tax=Trichonephila clavipes TaxID=2585209 RepID=A0A8X6SSR6_TRICX|nr:retrovirus-related Pol polyprotein from transposon 17.6 [Trichonephila clavipes]